MTRIIPAFAATVVACGIAASAMAGPFEDGISAYDRRDYSNAMRHWRPLADQGNPAAQSNVALMYAKGQGVPRDYVRAYMWSSLSASRGHRDGGRNRDSIAKGMTPPQISHAQKLAREWRPAR